MNKQINKFYLEYEELENIEHIEKRREGCNMFNRSINEN